MAVFIALLRAVNVGGTGKLPMQELRRACEEAGLSRVATYIASGNLVFGCDKSAKGAKSIMEDVLRQGFGLTRNHVLIRTQGELARVIAANPFPQAAAERPNWLVVNFLDGEADAGAAERLGAYEGPERMRLAGNHLYLDYPQGLGRSKLTAAFLDKALKLPSTARNWNTTNKLLAMARELRRLMPIVIALIRAIGPATHLKMSMRDLCDACTAAGLERVVTCGQTGNLLLDTRKSLSTVQTSLETVLRGFDLGNEVFLRRPHELATIIAADPFPEAVAARPSELAICFLEGTPSRAGLERLAGHRGPERFKLLGRDLCIDYAAGITGSKLLPSVVERTLEMRATARNWNTLRKLHRKAEAFRSLARPISSRSA